METGTIIKSTKFNTSPYWVVKCDSSSDELPINPLTMPSEYNNFMGRWYSKPLLGRKVKFELEEIEHKDSSGESFSMWYACIE